MEGQFLLICHSEVKYNNNKPQTKTDSYLMLFEKILWLQELERSTYTNRLNQNFVTGNISIEIKENGKKYHYPLTLH